MPLRTVEEYIESKSVNDQEVLLYLRELILETSYAMKETIRYGIPFYSLHNHICFLNVRASGQIQVGFYYGAELNDDFKILQSEELKQVRHYNVQGVDSVDIEAFIATVNEAIRFDKEIYEAKKLGKKKK